jgi:hypothetical protein
MIKHLAGLLTLSVLVAAPVHARDVKAWGDASSVGRAALVVLALGLPAVREDWTGDLEAGGSIGAAFVATQGLKRAFPEERQTVATARAFHPVMPRCRLPLRRLCKIATAGGSVCQRSLSRPSWDSHESRRASIIGTMSSPARQSVRPQAFLSRRKETRMFV